ncbi:AtpZ/AtpI family protein [Congregibacter variabilis]|uniref:AtpZ/AtpI family protein n=1 Tax=Congregibacter variabilis TaxID=3081200 RepID=A0ABZ0I0U9_9GAMM|nr:AtpZ/AtpI family protein [Congregibacter sp. IMCC43200]
MPESPEKKLPGTSRKSLQDEVGRKAERKLRARLRSQHRPWFWLGMFGLVGWSIAIPTLVGVVLGLWIDRRWPGQVSWSLSLLFIGVVVGCLNAWYWVKQESHRD